MNERLFDDHSVLILEESKVLIELFETWLSEVSTRPVSSVEEFHEQLDPTVTVACLCQSVLGDDEEKVRKQLLATNPYTQLILVLPRDTAFTSPFEAQYDACLIRPIFEEEIQSAVEERLKYGVYSALLREFYHLNSKLIWLRRADARKNDQSDMNPAKLMKRSQDIRTKLHWLQRRLDDEAIREIAQSLDLHKRYLQEPVRDEIASKQSKYHPPRCPQCKLQWGVDHGNELQTGFERVGATVWKCTQCGDLIHGLGESHRSVASH